MSLYVCVHGHFYQPPRENPWLEEVENQKSAVPYDNWNERITEECYAPNGAARLLDGSGMITAIRNNYSRMSFNFGPTLLSWMEEHSPSAYENILKADNEGRKRFSGHGPAIAQAYNHMILPLATDRDKRTQILWGIADFERRFRRFPEGMWLPETAVDLKTLEFLSEEGLMYTVLSPFQAARMRLDKGSPWMDIRGGRVDPSEPYLCWLPSGRSISVFFYDGGISQDIAFGGLLDDGEKFAGRLLAGHGTGTGDDRLVSVATDGETYGHHHKYGDMALAYCLEKIERSTEAELTIYGEYLEKHPPSGEVEILENSSWSCVHGIERWRGDCGCCTGANPGWDQAWRKPLREGLDRLRDEMEPLFLEVLQGKIRDPWKARDGYISVILDRTGRNMEDFLKDNSLRELSPDEKQMVFKAFEMERSSMLMFTSCGWFFDDLSGIETLQILRYAAHAMQYARELSGRDLEPLLLDFMDRTRSNIPDMGKGVDIYMKSVRPFMFDLARVGVHYGILSLFVEDEEDISTYCYSVTRKSRFSLNAGKTRLCSGCLHISSRITLETCRTWFVSLGLGGHNVICCLATDMGEKPFITFTDEISDSFSRGNIPAMIEIIRSRFGGCEYDMGSLFRNEQQKILNSIISDDLARLEDSLQEIMEDDYLIMNFISSVQMPVPQQFLKAAEVVLNSDMAGEFRKVLPYPDHIRNSFNTARRWNIPLDMETIELAASRWMDSRMEVLSTNYDDHATLKGLIAVLKTVREIGINPDMWYSQNMFFRIMTDLNRTGKERGPWKAYFQDLGRLLGVRI